MRRSQLLLLVIILLLLTGCSKNHVTNRTVLEEVWTEAEHYQKYTDKKNVYLLNKRTGAEAVLSIYNGETLAAMELPEFTGEIPKIKSIDPRGVSTDFTLDIVNTYTYTDPINISKYVKALEQDGYKFYIKINAQEYIDYWASKNESSVRIIVIDDLMKVFYNLPIKAIDPYTYIIKDTKE